MDVGGEAEGGGGDGGGVSLRYGTHPNSSRRDQVDAGRDSAHGRISCGTAQQSPRVERRPRSTQEAGMLANLSNMIDDNLQLFRAGAALTVLGSGATLAFFLYSRGFHGFSSVSRLPASYYRHRKRLRVRVSKVVAVAPDPLSFVDHVPSRGSHDAGRWNMTGAEVLRFPLGQWRDGGSLVEDRRQQSSSIGELDYDHASRSAQGSDVFLQAEHITLPRRLLRLPARSLPVGRAAWKRGGRGLAAADTLILRLCGVEATAQGIAEARKFLTRSTPAVQYCDAELVFQEKRRLLVAGTVVGAREEDTEAAMLTAVAVCHIHRRRGFWRDVLPWFRIDPVAGFGARLLEEGSARLRQERCLLGGGGGSAAEGVMHGGHSGAEAFPDGLGGDDYDGMEQSPVALERLRADLGKLRIAEENARRSRKGLWAAEIGEEEVTSGSGKEGRGRSEGSEGPRLGWLARGWLAVGGHAVRSTTPRSRRS